MSRVIDADELENKLRTEQRWIVKRDEYTNEGFSYDQVMFTIDRIPTIDAIPTVHGHWTYDASNMRCVCSECNHHLFQIVRPIEFKYFVEQNKFCFNCGADMRERSNR